MSTGGGPGSGAAAAAGVPEPDHELEVLEGDETVPPRAEEEAADAARAGTAPVTPPPGDEPV